MQNINLNHFSLPAMNSQLDIVLWGAETSFSQTAIQEAANRVQKLERIISRYDPNAELFQLNKTAHQHPVKMSMQLFEAIQYGVKYYQNTNGYFDIFNGSLFHSWKTGDTENVKTTGNGEPRVSIDEENRTIQFLQSNVSLDFGGIGKGMALQAIDAVFSSNSIEHAFVSFGGSSILTRGHHPHGLFWPFTLTGYPDRIWELNNAFLSVSKSIPTTKTGMAAHLLNPKTGEPVLKHKTAVVQALNPIDAEVLSTTLLIASEEEHSTILQNFNNIDYQFFNH